MIFLSIIIFLLVIWFLVAILLFARRKLLPNKKVKIVINDEKEFEVNSGTTLLHALTDEQILMPSGCGGKGTCGTCKGRVLSGGGDMLPTEKAFITKKMEQNHYRLFCQVKVKEDCRIEIPKEIFGVKKWECEVLSNNNLSTFIKEFVVKLPEGENIDFQSGGYIQIDIPKYKINYQDIIIDEKYQSEWQKMHLFDLSINNNESAVRAYSMANHPVENDRVMLNVRIATPPFDRKKGGFKKVKPGVGSSYIFSLKPGDKVMVSGPYGDFLIRDNEREMMFIGGGAGMAPMRSHIFDLFKTKHTSRKVSLWYGGRSLRELFYINDFENIEKENSNFSFHFALSDPLPEDHWQGNTGFIHQVIYDNYLIHHPAPENIDYYICGPPLMLRAVRSMLDNLGVSADHIFFDDFGN